MAVGVALVLVGGQTGLNRLNCSSNKAVTNGLYALFMALGFGIGPIIGPYLYQYSPVFAFTIGGGIILLGIPFARSRLGFQLPKASVNAVMASINQWQLAKRISIPVHAVFSYGFLEATLFTVFPLFLLRQQYDLEQMGYAFTLLMVGSLISVVPVTFLADRFGNLPMLCICILVGISGGLGLIQSSDYQTIIIFSLIGGIGFGPVFPLSLSMVASALSSSQLAQGNGLFTAMFSFGCAAGPLLTAIMIAEYGMQHVFTLVVMLFLSVLIHAVLTNGK
jgi:MFS family permease